MFNPSALVTSSSVLLLEGAETFSVVSVFSMTGAVGILWSLLYPLLLSSTTLKQRLSTLPLEHSSDVLIFTTEPMLVSAEGGEQSMSMTGGLLYRLIHASMDSAMDSTEETGPL